MSLFHSEHFERTQIWGYHLQCRALRVTCLLVEGCCGRESGGFAMNAEQFGGAGVHSLPKQSTPSWEDSVVARTLSNRCSPQHPHPAPQANNLCEGHTS